MARFAPPPTHANLSTEAKALAIADPAAIAGQALAAETMLGIAGLPAGADDDERAVLAVVLQINWSLGLGEEGGARRSETKGDESYSLAFGAQTGIPEALSPQAKLIADALLAEYAEVSPVAELTEYRSSPSFSNIQVVF